MQATKRLVMVGLMKLRPSPFNRRDLGDLQGLKETIKVDGVLQAIKVRSLGASAGGDFEIIFGHRRFAACQELELPQIPAEVVEMDDEEVMRTQIIENIQRLDVTPLEEARAYKTLMSKGRDVAAIAADVGKSPRHIYDRLGLLRLSTAAAALLRKGEITAGHAIEISRLKRADQARLLDPDSGGLWNPQHLLWDPRKEDEDLKNGKDPMKPVSVRELRAWIDQNVRFDLKTDDLPELFPETLKTLKENQSMEEPAKVIPITFEYVTRPEVKDGNRIWGPNSWKEVKGKCGHEVIGVIVVGPGRGEAFPVCTAKKKCSVHWGKEQRAAKKLAKAKEGRASKPDKYEQAQERARLTQKREDQERARWKKARKPLLAATMDVVKTANSGGSGPLAKILVDRVMHYGTPKSPIDIGTTADELVRHLAAMVLSEMLKNEWQAPREFGRLAKSLGLDVKKILDEHAPLPKPEKKAKGKTVKKNPTKKVKSKKKAAKRGMVRRRRQIIHTGR